jgi:hypothetical protein
MIRRLLDFVEEFESDPCEMPQGRYAGLQIRCVPSWYLGWALTGLVTLPEDARAEIERELCRRGRTKER